MAPNIFLNRLPLAWSSAPALSVTSNQSSLLNASPWDEVLRIYRRICVLRVNGHTEEAARVQSVDLAKAVSFAQEIAGRDPELRLPALFAAEEERVLNAKVLADILAPLVVEKLRGQVVAPVPPTARKQPELPSVPAAAVAASTPPSTPSTAPVPQASSPAASAPSSAPSVADLIDGMLAQERRSSPERLRRAS